MQRAARPPKAANHNGIRCAQVSQWRLSKALIPRCNSAVLSHALPHRDLLTIFTRRLIVPSD